MSLYGEYIKERLGDGIVETESGFATYRIINEGKSVYIVDIYVHPDFRKTKLASEMADMICQIGKNLGATELIGTVVPSSNNSTDSLRVLLGYGMRLHSAGQDMIVFRKEL